MWHVDLTNPSIMACEHVDRLRSLTMALSPLSLSQSPCRSESTPSAACSLDVLYYSNIVTDGFYVARTGLGPFGEGWEEKGEDVDWFLYNRLWGVGVFTLMENIGLEPTEEVGNGSLGSRQACLKLALRRHSCVGLS